MFESIVPVEAVLLTFMLGLRHGLDPDHIAMVDSLSFGRSGQARPAWAAGAMFAAGHGAAVTVAAIAMQALSRELTLAEPWGTLLSWLPVALLLMVGTSNLRMLLSTEPYRPSGIARGLTRWCGSANPLAAFGVGVMFALVFDTASQLAAWGYAGSSEHGAGAAVLVGVAFTAGMVVVDALDGYLIHRLLANPDRKARERYRRRIGWLTVAAAYGVAAHGGASNIWPELEMGETSLTVLGASMVGAFLLLGLWNRWQRTRPALELGRLATDEYS